MHKILLILEEQLQYYYIMLIYKNIMNCVVYNYVASIMLMSNLSN